MDAASPTQTVLTLGPTCLMVSKTAIPAKAIPTYAPSWQYICIQDKRGLRIEAMHDPTYCKRAVNGTVVQQRLSCKWICFRGQED